MIALIFDSFGSIPTTQLLVNDLHPSANNLIEVSKFEIKTGLNTLSSKLPWLPAKEIAVWLPKTWVQSIVNDSD